MKFVVRLYSGRIDECMANRLDKRPLIKQMLSLLIVGRYSEWRGLFQGRLLRHYMSLTTESSPFGFLSCSLFLVNKDLSVSLSFIYPVEIPRLHDVRKSRNPRFSSPRPQQIFLRKNLSAGERLKIAASCLPKGQSRCFALFPHLCENEEKRANQLDCTLLIF